MRYLLSIVCLGVAAALVLPAALAKAGDSQATNSQLPLGTNPHPIVWPGIQWPSPQSKSPAPAQSSAGTPVTGTTQQYFPYGVCYPYAISYGYGYSPYYGYDPYYGYPYGYYGSAYRYPTYYYPWPANSVSRPAVDVGAAKPQANDGRDEEAPATKKAMERGTSAQSVATAWKYIGYGDTQFAKKNYSGANERYRRAANIAPQLADACFRQGFALAATSRYESAVNAMQRGLKIDRAWPASAFRLADLYGADQAAMTAHIEAVAKASSNNPTDADLLFLVGVYLHFDGQAERAGKFFERAGELAGGDTDHIRAFLPK